MSASWGYSSWAYGSYVAERTHSEASGILPTCPPHFDLACFQKDTTLKKILTYPGISLFSKEPCQFEYLSASSCLQLKCNPAQGDYPVIFRADVGVPESWTVELSLRINSYPLGFNNVQDNHVGVSVVNEQGVCCTLFFSRAGIMHAGAAAFDSVTGEITYQGRATIPQSEGLVELGREYVLRVVGEKPSGMVYVYLTLREDLWVRGHQLRFVLPAHVADDAGFLVKDGVFISCAGKTVPTGLCLHALRVSSKVLVPNNLPVADPGKDLFIRSCTVARLSARKSFGPEGSDLTFFWRMVDGPSESVYVGEFQDGTAGSEAPFTGKLYSEGLKERYNLEGFHVGDVITTKEGSFGIKSIHTDPAFHVVLDRSQLLPGEANKHFRLVTQNSLMNAGEMEPSFFADCPGAFRFELKVSDGRNMSLPAYLTVVSTEAAVERGEVPDVSFLWDYLSNFWKLVEGTEHIETFWGACTQIASAEMLSVWQHGYSKSLAEVQRTFKRRWLHYDLLLPEPIQEQSKVRSILSGVTSEPIGAAGISCSRFITLRVSGEEYQMMLPEQDVYSAGELKDHLDKALRYEGLTDFSVEILEPTAAKAIRLVSPRVFSVKCEGLLDGKSSLVQGDQGRAVLGGFDTGISLQGLGVKEEDWLLFGGGVYRIYEVSFGKAPGDVWPQQRLLLKDPIVSGLSGPWKIVRPSISSSQVYLEGVSEGDSITFEVVSGDVESATEKVLAVHPDMPNLVAHGVEALESFLGEKCKCKILSIFRRKLSPIPKEVLHIPHLAGVINGAPDDEVLRENIDFFLEDLRGRRFIRFDQKVWGDEPPLPRLWAEFSYIDNSQKISDNFGKPIGFSLEDHQRVGKDIDYLSAVRGIWFAHMHGPTLRNLRVGVQILLGLPFSPAKGTILQIQAAFSDQQGRILFRDEDGHITSFLYPKQLGLEINPHTGDPFKAGDEVEAFYPLVRGVEILDYISDKAWMDSRIAQGTFREVEKFFRFLVRMDRKAFSLPALTLIREFIKRAKPTYTHPVFSVLSEGSDSDLEVDVRDSIRKLARVKLSSDLSPDGVGSALKLEDLSAAGGGFRLKLDEHSRAYPHKPWVGWGLDKSYLHPNDFIWVEKRADVDEDAYPQLDGLLTLDMPFSPDKCSVSGSPLNTYMGKEAVTTPLDVKDLWDLGESPSVSPTNTTGMCIQVRANEKDWSAEEEPISVILYKDTSLLLGFWQLSLGLHPFAFKVGSVPIVPLGEPHRVCIGHRASGRATPWVSGLIWESPDLRVWQFDVPFGVSKVAVARLI